LNIPQTPSFCEAANLSPKTFLHQLKAIAVTVISLFVALCGLTYNTWRDKIIDENRSVCIASFE